MIMFGPENEEIINYKWLGRRIRPVQQVGPNQLRAVAQPDDKPGIHSNRLGVVSEKTDTPLQEFRPPIVIRIEKSYELATRQLQTRVPGSALPLVCLRHDVNSVPIRIGHSKCSIGGTVIHDNDL